jgi:hypothetical protein
VLYTSIWRNKWLTSSATSLTEMAAMLRGAAENLESMAAAGVRLDTGGMEDDYALLSTEDAAVAQRFGFELEDEDDALEA